MTPSLAAQLRGRRVGVALSSAYFGFYAHTGFVRALAERGIAPAIVSGASAGAMVAAFYAAGVTPDEMARHLRGLRRQDFWDPAPLRSVIGRRRGGWTVPGLIRTRKFAHLLGTILPVARFEDCTTALVTVSTNLTRTARHIDATGALLPAVVASCALPFLFEPVEREGDLHADGGIIDKAPVGPMRTVAAARGLHLDAIVVHYIPSRGVTRPLGHRPWKFFDAALDLVRDDVWRTQCAVARAEGVEIVVIETPPAPVGPFELHAGMDALENAAARTLRQLDAPAVA